MSSKFIPVIACVRTSSFLFKAESHSIVPIHHIWFIYSSVYGHLDCFYPLADVDNGDMNMGVQISVWVPAFSSFGCIPRSGITGSLGRCKERAWKAQEEKGRISGVARSRSSSFLPQFNPWQGERAACHGALKLALCCEAPLSGLANQLILTSEISRCSLNLIHVQKFTDISRTQRQKVPWPSLVYLSHFKDVRALRPKELKWLAQNYTAS